MSVSRDNKRTYMKSGDRRAQILTCARQVFAEKGFHNTSIADICEHAGIGRGTLYQHFGNKRDVFFAVVDEIAARVGTVITTRTRIRELEGAAGAPPQLIAAYSARRLRDLLDAVFADEASLRLVLREARGLDGGVDEVMRRVDAAVLGAFTEDLEAACTMGVLDVEDPKMTAMFVIGGVEKLVLAAIEADHPIDLDRIVRVTTQVQLFGVLSEHVRHQVFASNDTEDDPETTVGQSGGTSTETETR